MPLSLLNIKILRIKMPRFSHLTQIFLLLLLAGCSSHLQVAPMLHANEYGGETIYLVHSPNISTLSEIERRTKFDFLPNKTYAKNGKTYICFGANLHELPAIYALNYPGSKVKNLVNFRVKGDRYEIDGEPEVLVLIRDSEEIILYQKNHEKR